MKAAIFVEGQTEAIFTRALLEQSIPLGDLYVDIIALSKSSGAGKPLRSFSTNSSASNYYNIFIAPGDGSVLSSLKDRLEGLLFRGSEVVVGLKDLYGSDYLRLSGGKLDLSLNEVYRESAAKQSEDADPKGRVQFSYAEMETEAWMLSMPGLFEAIDSKLSFKFIQDSLGYDLATISPEATFLHPAPEVSNILQLVGKKYDKHTDEVEMIVAHITDGMILKLIGDGKAPSFNRYVSAILPGLV